MRQRSRVRGRAQPPVQLPPCGGERRSASRVTLLVVRLPRPPPGAKEAQAACRRAGGCGGHHGGRPQRCGSRRFDAVDGHALHRARPARGREAVEAPLDDDLRAWAGGRPGGDQPTGAGGATGGMAVEQPISGQDGACGRTRRRVSCAALPPELHGLDSQRKWATPSVCGNPDTTSKRMHRLLNPNVAKCSKFEEVQAATLPPWTASSRLRQAPHRPFATPVKGTISPPGMRRSRVRWRTRRCSKHSSMRRTAKALASAGGPQPPRATRPGRGSAPGAGSGCGR